MRRLVDGLQRRGLRRPGAGVMKSQDPVMAWRCRRIISVTLDLGVRRALRMEALRLDRFIARPMKFKGPRLGCRSAAATAREVLNHLGSVRLIGTWPKKKASPANSAETMKRLARWLEINSKKAAFVSGLVSIDVDL